MGLATFMEDILPSECFNCAAYEKQIAELKDALEASELKREILHYELKGHKKVAEQLSKESDELQNLKATARLNVRDQLGLDYHMLADGKLPVLWVNADNHDIFPPEHFTTMANRIKEINPEIKLIILTYGVDSLQQLDDAGLENLGLYRK